MQATTPLAAPNTVARTPPRGFSRKIRRRRDQAGPAVRRPWIIGFLAFFVYPFFATLYYSFTNFDGVQAPNLIGFTNYVNLFHDPLFKTSLFNTFYYTACELPLSTVVALGLALLLNMDVKGRAIYRTIFYVPSIVPTVASCLIFVWIFNPASGIVNDLLTGPTSQGRTGSSRSRGQNRRLFCSACGASASRWSST